MKSFALGDPPIDTDRRSVFRALLWAWLLPLVVLASFSQGCSRKMCKEAGCYGWLKVTYSRPVSTPYDLNVTTRGLTLSTHCPQNVREARAVGANEARLGCDATSFELATRDDAKGTSPYGDNPADADPVSLNVTIHPLSSDSPPLKGQVQVHIAHVERPNGPECTPTCYGREATLVMAP